MNAEFNWWLLIVGLVVGAGLVWYVVFDGRRREIDIAEVERAREATWLAAVLADEGHDVSPATALRLLELHGRYLEAPPPDDVPDELAIDADADPDRDRPASGIEGDPIDQALLDDDAAPAGAGSELPADDRRGVE